LVPVAYHAGMQVTVDGAPVAVQSLEQMVAFEAPAGAHQVELALRPSGIHWLGWLVTGLALAGLAGLWRWGARS
jgi:uncharacterized membrane protein YfhO